MPLDLNHASREELVGLAGVGPTLADRIIAHRTRIGRFEAVDDLVHVSGVSERVLRRFAADVSVGAAGAASPAGKAPVVIVVIDDRGVGGDFTGHRVSATGLHVDSDVGPVPFAVSNDTDAAGGSQVELPTARLTGELTFKALAPDGTMLGTTAVASEPVPDKVTIAATAAPRPTTQHNDDPAAGKPTRIRGRVIDSNGVRPAAALQVVLWGATTNNPADADFRALVVATTDAAGHFSGPYPVGQFTQAHATVAVGEGTQTVVVHLADKAFPESVILVVDLPDDPHGDDPNGDRDCDCHKPVDAPRAPEATDLARADGTYSSDPGAGRCVDFTKPDRTLEEFTFTYLVRTTEPEIRGFTLAEPPKVDIADLIGRLKGTNLGANLRLRAGDADPAEFALAAGEVRALARVAGPDAANAFSAAAELPAGLVDARVLKTLARDPDGFSLGTLATAVRHTAFGDLSRYLGAVIKPRPGRGRLNGDNSIDWDDEFTSYQATTIAHGHVLRFKQEWVADGYSMGNLLYSLPLAPGQKKQIAVVDWERREQAARTESLTESERLDAFIDRDRDINEIVNGAVRESTRGGSSSSTGGFGGGLGVAGIFGPVGAVLGIGGGFGTADSDAWQNSSRSTSASALNQLRDRTVQSASAVRSQRSSVVQSAAQGERVTATTESVANYNHCHAITVQYFEVLRHLLVRQRLVDVQECLFVPLLMSRFDFDKALRWRHTLASAVSRALRGGLDAVDRIANNYAGSDLPLGRYADDNVELVEGELRLRFQLTRPRDKDDQFDPSTWNPLLKLFGFDAKDFYDNFLHDQQFKDRVFVEQMGPRIANAVISLLRIHAVKIDDTEVDLRIDPTLVGNFANDQSLYVSLRMTGALAPLKRSDIKAIRISSRLALPGLPFVLDALPYGSRVVVESGSLRYRTAHLADALFADTSIRNDLTGNDDVWIATPLSRRELRNPRDEDKQAVRALLDHLNENIERIHHHLWRMMGDDRRYMLLDGFEAPNSGGRSVASVVDNELIGIVGNCLVLPVARGFHLDPTFDQDAENPIDLLEHYEPNTPIEPSRVALPTRGVYAEAVMGACNSCEEKDETRFWRWEESPIPDGPTAINPVSTDTRRAEPPDLTAKDFPAPIIAMQAAPAAPDPTGLGAALALLGQSGLFKDITGLEGTQRNAAAALQGALDTATTFGTKAADLALQGKMSKDIDKAMKTIGEAKDKGLITPDQAQKLTETAIRGMVGAGTTNPPAATTNEELKDLTSTAGKNGAAVSVTRPTGEKVEVDARPAEGGAADSGRSFIIETDGDSPQRRAFGPAANDKTGANKMAVEVPKLPSGGTIRWSVPPDQAGRIDLGGAATATGEKVTVRGLRPGLTAVDVEARDAGGSRIESIKFRLSVPQFVTIGEDAAAFDGVLTSMNVLALKTRIIAEARRTCEHLLRTANVRLIWRVGASTDTLPSHVPAARVVALTLRGDPPAGNPGLEGRTNLVGGVFGTGVDNETIDVWPGAFTNIIPGDETFVDTETVAVVLELQSTPIANPALEDLAVRIVGRLIGETMAHEIVHALIGPVHLPATPDAHDLMEVGGRRNFLDRTGIEDTSHTSPVVPTNFVDHGLTSIAGIGAGNQALIDANFPVPPAFT
jgi:competence ComEA-like helix-hairpin-helix protein